MAKADEKKDAAAEAREQTERVVLVKLVIPSKALDETHPFRHLAATTLPNGDIEAWVPVRNEKAEHGPDGEVRIFVGSKRKVIEEFTGTGEDEKPGAFKAVSARSWRGTKVNVLPEKPKVETLWED